MNKAIKKSLRDILNEIKWTKNLDQIEIWYVHRGVKNNTKIINGKDIIDIRKSYLDTFTSTIPYHRIFKVIDNGKVIFNRKHLK